MPIRRYLQIFIAFLLTGSLSLTALWFWLNYRSRGSEIVTAGTLMDLKPQGNLIGGKRVPEDPPASDNAFSMPRFRNVAVEAAFDFRFFRGNSGEFWTPEMNGGGVAWLDFDGDGWLDLFAVNGCQLPPDPSDRSQRSQLFRNGQGVRFLAVGENAEVDLVGYGQGCGVGDYDNDGFDDLYVTYFGHENIFCHNNGDGTFSDVTSATGTGANLWSSSCAFADLDRDGDLELYVCTYVDFDPKTTPICFMEKENNIRIYCGPRDYKPLPQVLFLNDGDGRFHDVFGAASKTPFLLARSLAVGIADFDDDARPDVYVANDSDPNNLLHNECSTTSGQGTPDDRGFLLNDIGLGTGAGVNSEGLSQASMGVAIGDYDEDGLLDIAVTNFHLEYLSLYHNLGSAGFVESSRSTGIVASTRNRMGWGIGFIDYDNDGWLDLFATNGYLADHHPRYPCAMLPNFLRNTGQGQFVETSELANSCFTEKRVSRAAAFADYDNDGRTDIAVIHHYDPSDLFHNEANRQNHALLLEFVGRQSNRNGVNVRVEAILKNTQNKPNRRLVREVIGGGSYQSASDRRILLGIGSNDVVDQLTVRWPSGRVDEWENLAADQWLNFVEGSAPRPVAPLPPPHR